VKWVSGHKFDGARLSPEQKQLREFYSRLINLVGEPAFRDGKFFPLNPANRDNPHFGRLPGEVASGHWLYAFLRYDPAIGQRFAVIANLHPTVRFEEVVVSLPNSALQFLSLSHEADCKLVDRLGDSIAIRTREGISVTKIAPRSALYLEFLL